MKHTKQGVVEDIWIDTQVNPDDVPPEEPADPSHWREVEEDNLLLNPDAESMEWRG